VFSLGPKAARCFDSLLLQLLAIRNGVKIENANIEIRNPKQYQNPNLQNSKQRRDEADVLSFWSFKLAKGSKEVVLMGVNGWGW